MDPVTHGLTGAMLSFIPPKRKRTMLVLVMASLLPDIDYVTRIFGADEFLRYHRGITHGILALFVCPLLIGLVCRSIFKKGFFYYSLIGFLGYSVHLLMDLTNQYPTRILSPLDWSNYSLNLSFIIDPYTIGAVVVGILWGVKKSPARKRIIATAMLLFIILLMGLRYELKNRAEEFLRSQLDEYQYTLCPLPNDFLRWWFVTRSGMKYKTGFVDLFSKTVSVVNVIIYNEDAPEIRESKQLRTIKNFLFFAQAPVPDIKTKDGKTTVYWKELTYSYIPGDRFVATVEFDRFGKVVRQGVRF